jgi:hypothetical protein
MRYTPSSHYPAAREVSELFDLEVLSSLDGFPGAEDKEVVALGNRPEPDAGLRGGQVTPYFNSMSDLESFCQKYIDQFRIMADNEYMPDATEWKP